MRQENHPALMEQEQMCGLYTSEPRAVATGRRINLAVAIILRFEVVDNNPIN